MHGLNIEHPTLKIEHRSSASAVLGQQQNVQRPTFNFQRPKRTVLIHLDIFPLSLHHSPSHAGLPR
jgi:hypothetical protein